LILKNFIPAPFVREFVQLYRIVHLQFDKDAQIPFKAYPPRPEQCLAFYPFDTEQVTYANSNKCIENVPIVLYGQFLEVTNRLIQPNFLVFQIIFNPGALYRLLGISANALINEYLDAEVFFSSEIRNVNERLFYAKDYNQMVEVANQFMSELIKKQKKEKSLVDSASLFMLDSDNRMSVDQLAKMSCLSTKQLERKFKERTGVNPKLFEQIIRFDKAFRLRNAYPSYDWLRIALECGYYDYQHLCKSYQWFTGLSPKEFHELENKAPERRFGLHEGYYG